MELRLLETIDSVQAALTTMNPVAREAAALFAQRLFDNPVLLQNGKAAMRECCEASAVSLGRRGIDVVELPEALDVFLKENGCAVMNVGFSIAHMAIKERDRKAMWGTVGKVAAAAVGVAIGIWIS